jgi:hypothetical protein
MPKLRKVCHEKFAQAVASGLNASEAYRQVSGNHKNANVHSDEWMKCRGVEERIRELQEENNRKSELSREEALAFLANVVRTPAGDVGPHDALCQAHKHTIGDGWESHDIRVPDKLGAIQQLARMCNWNAPEKFQVSGDTLSAYLVALRAEPLFELKRPALPLENGGNGEESRG